MIHEPALLGRSLTQMVQYLQNFIIHLRKFHNAGQSISYIATDTRSKMSDAAFFCHCLILTITIWLVIGAIVSHINQAKFQPIDFIPEKPTLDNQTANFSREG